MTEADSGLRLARWVLVSMLRSREGFDEYVLWDEGENEAGRYCIIRDVTTGYCYLFSVDEIKEAGPHDLAIYGMRAKEQMKWTTITV